MWELISQDGTQAVHLAVQFCEAVQLCEEAQLLFMTDLRPQGAQVLPEGCPVAGLGSSGC